MTSRRLKDLLSHVRQTGETRDETRDNPLSQRVSPPVKNDVRETGSETSFSAEYLKDINAIAGRDTNLSHVSPPGACDMRQPNLSGVSPEFAARLSAEDLEDIAAGDIPLGTVQEFEQAAIAREAADLKEFFQERAGILEHDAGLLRPEAELEAARSTATYARNRGYLWASLRAALSGYPALSPQVPDRAGTVDSLPFGMAGVHVHEGAKPDLASGSVVITEAELEAARKGRTVVRQGTFTGAHEVKA